MKTRSLWGNPPKRLYRFINAVKEKFGEGAHVCVIGASDGKFVIPMLRMGLKVTAVEIDDTALYGGIKAVPVKRENLVVPEYVPADNKVEYEMVPFNMVRTKGLLERAKEENLMENLEVVKVDFYHNGLDKQFDAVFTSCSIQYKGNRDLSLKEAVDKVKSIVKPGGLCYMDYMMPLEESHCWKSALFARNKEMGKQFLGSWHILHNYEQQKPIFEEAHVDRPADHFHRFGFILAERECA